MKCDTDESMDLAQQSGGDYSREYPEPRITGRQGGAESTHGPDEHHAFDA